MKFNAAYKTSFQELPLIYKRNIED